MTTIMALLLSAAMLTGCGGTSKKDYENEDYKNDVDALTNIYEDLNNASISLLDAAENLEVITPEGKQIKSDMQEMAEIYEK